MIRLSYPAATSGDRTASFDKDVVRFGRGPDCDVCLDARSAARVALHHGDFVREGGTYVVVDHQGRNGLWVNGKRTLRAPLSGGERIRVGAVDGPEIRVTHISTAPPEEE